MKIAFVKDSAYNWHGENSLLKIVVSLDLHGVYLAMDFACELSKFTAESWMQAVAKTAIKILHIFMNALCKDIIVFFSFNDHIRT